MGITILTLIKSYTNCEEAVSAISYKSLPVCMEDCVPLEKETLCFLTWNLRMSEWVISESFSSQVSCLEAEKA